MLLPGCIEDFCAVMNVTDEEKTQYKTAHVEDCSEEYGNSAIDGEDLKRLLNSQDTFPVFSCRATQPLDVSLFGPLATFYKYSQNLDDWVIHTHARTLFNGKERVLYALLVCI